MRQTGISGLSLLVGAVHTYEPSQDVTRALWGTSPVPVRQRPLSRVRGPQ
ncbi:hypothetical protein ACE1SV_65590 [Streptomyces sp. E-15]